MSRNQIIGQFGEQIACDYLIKNAYSILEKNLRFGNKEIDIIAFKNNTIIFVEVKTRTNSFTGDGVEAVEGRKINYLIHAAERYLDLKEPNLEARIDLITIIIDKPNKTAKIKHYKDIA